MPLSKSKTPHLPFQVQSNLLYIAGLTSIVIVFIFIYGWLVKNVLKKDVLENKFAKCSGCDYWAVTHFLFFMFLGFSFPHHFLLLAILGIVWEGVEVLLGGYKVKILGDGLHIIGNTDEKGNAVATDGFWYGRVSDIAFNTVGIALGIYLRQNFKKENRLAAAQFYNSLV
jgi:hypothetical protein